MTCVHMRSRSSPQAKLYTPQHSNMGASVLYEQGARGKSYKKADLPLAVVLFPPTIL